VDASHVGSGTTVLLVLAVLLHCLYLLLKLPHISRRSRYAPTRALYRPEIEAFVAHAPCPDDNQNIDRPGFEPTTSAAILGCQSYDKLGTHQRLSECQENRRRRRNEVMIKHPTSLQTLRCSRPCKMLMPI